MFSRAPSVSLLSFINIIGLVQEADNRNLFLLPADFRFAVSKPLRTSTNDEVSEYMTGWIAFLRMVLDSAYLRVHTERIVMKAPHTASIILAGPSQSPML